MAAPMMMTVVMTKDEMMSALRVAESPALGKPLYQSMDSMMATTEEKTTVITQARNPCENCLSGGRVCVLRKDVSAAMQNKAIEQKD